MVVGPDRAVAGQRRVGVGAVLGSESHSNRWPALVRQPWPGNGRGDSWERGACRELQGMQDELMCCLDLRAFRAGDQLAPDTGLIVPPRKKILCVPLSQDIEIVEA